MRLTLILLVLVVLVAVAYASPKSKKTPKSEKSGSPKSAKSEKSSKSEKTGTKKTPKSPKTSPKSPHTKSTKTHKSPKSDKSPKSPPRTPHTKSPKTDSPKSPPTPKSPQRPVVTDCSNIDESSSCMSAKLWLCQYRMYREQITSWTEGFKLWWSNCNVVDNTDYTEIWRESFKCIDTSNLRCRNGDGQRICVDEAPGCRICRCMDDEYSSPMDIFKQWRLEAAMYKVRAKIYKMKTEKCSAGSGGGFSGCFDFGMNENADEDNQQQQQQQQGGGSSILDGLSDIVDEVKDELTDVVEDVVDEVQE